MLGWVRHSLQRDAEQREETSSKGPEMDVAERKRCWALPGAGACSPGFTIQNDP